LYVFLISFIHHICPVQFVLLDLITVIIIDEKGDIEVAYKT
jgi:hypothetical protein